MQCLESSGSSDIEDPRLQCSAWRGRGPQILRTQCCNAVPGAVWLDDYSVQAGLGALWLEDYSVQTGLGALWLEDFSAQAGLGAFWLEEYRGQERPRLPLNRR